MRDLDEEECVGRAFGTAPRYNSYPSKTTLSG
jgi:hypothetical protein